MARLSVVGLLVAVLPLLFIKCERHSNVQSILAENSIKNHNRFSRLREINAAAGREPTVDYSSRGLPEKTENLAPHHTVLTAYGTPKDIPDEDPQQQEEPEKEDDDDDDEDEDETTEEQEEETETTKKNCHDDSPRIDRSRTRR